ncbi:hypothetical protein Sjap_006946 [Stephania japonica]|uniref:Uncharacterized protein n=1 Tax=Stephania japonica TaxID=461633 RepID=A0AAP0K6T3_9MAGN
MVWESCKQSGKRGLKTSLILRESFYIFTLALLSLLLPLSFLLLARLSRVKYFLTIIPNTAPPVSYILSLFLHTNPTILCLLISFVSVTALVHVVTGRVPILIISESTSTVIRPQLYTAWIMLCTLQVCVGLGIEGTIAAGVWRGEYDGGRVINLSLLSRVLFFVGLHETMVHWSRVFVRPVVDDTIFGSVMNERWVERAVISASYGGLWWWKLREEAEGLLLMSLSRRRDLQRDLYGLLRLSAAA